MLFLPAIYAESIVIDAELNEKDWEKALVIDEYYETSPYTLKPGSLKTVTRIISNEDGIYIGSVSYTHLTLPTT